MFDENTNCTELALDIFLSSGEFKQHQIYLEKLKNEGTIISWGVRIEGSPLHPEYGSMEYSKHYEFAIREELKEHYNTIDRYLFNPETRALQKYDFATNSYNDIPFDPKTLNRFLTQCQ